MCTHIVKYLVCGRYIGPEEVLNCYYFKLAQAITHSINLGGISPTSQQVEQLEDLARRCAADKSKKRFCENIRRCLGCLEAYNRLGAEEVLRICAYPYIPGQYE